MANGSRLQTNLGLDVRPDVSPKGRIKILNLINVTATAVTNPMARLLLQ
jgi:hypothetical protein